MKNDSLKNKHYKFLAIEFVIFICQLLLLVMALKYYIHQFTNVSHSALWGIWLLVNSGLIAVLIIYTFGCYVLKERSLLFFFFMLNCLPCLIFIIDLIKDYLTHH